MSLVAAAVAAARQQKPRLHAFSRQSEVWLNADSLHANSQFWYDQAKYHDYDGEAYLWLPGLAGAYVSRPDEAAFTLAGDIDIIAKIAPSTWSPSSPIMIVSKRSGVGSVSWSFGIVSGGRLELTTSFDGTNAAYTKASASVAFSNDTAHWVRATYASTSGIKRFYTSEDGVSWNEVGVAQTVTPGSVYDSNDPIIIGAYNGGGYANLEGKVYHAIIKDGIDGTIAGQFAATTYAEHNWTLNGQAMNGSYPVVVEHARVPRYRALLGSSLLADAQMPRVLSLAEPASIFMNGSGQYYGLPPEKVGVDFAQDFEVKFKIAPSEWTSSTAGGIIGQWTASGDQRSWGIDLHNGQLYVYACAAGTAATISNKTSVNIASKLIAINGEWLEFKIKFFYLNGGFNVAMLGRAPDDPSWVTIGGGTIGSGIYAPTAYLLGGSRIGGSNTFVGRMAYVQIDQNGQAKAVLRPNATAEWVQADSPIIIPANNDGYAYGPGTTTNSIWSAAAPQPISYSTGVSLRLDVKPDWSTAGALYRFHTGVYVTTDGGGNVFFQKWDTSLTTSADHRARFTLPAFLKGQRYQLRFDWNIGAQPVAYYALNNVTTQSLRAQDNWIALVRNTDMVNLVAANPVTASQRTTVLSNFNYGSYMLGRVYRAEVAYDGTYSEDPNVRFDPKTAAASGWAPVYTATGYQAHIINRNTIMFDGVDDYIEYPQREGIQPLNRSITYGICAALTEQITPYYPRLFSMEDGASTYPAVMGYYINESTKLASQFDDGAGGVSPTVNFTITGSKPVVLGGVIDRSTNLFNTYTHVGMSPGSNIAAYGSVTIASNMCFGRASYTNQESLSARGFRMYGFFVVHQSMTQTQLNSVGKSVLPEAYP